MGRPVSTLRPRTIQYEAVRVLRVSPPHDIGRHHDRRQSHECDQRDYDVTRARLLSDTCQRVRHCPAAAASGPPETDVDRFSPPPRPIGAQGRRVPSTRSDGRAVLDHVAPSAYRSY
jgi:hypothetical protein